MQEKVSIIVVQYGQKFPSLGSPFGISQQSLVMPNRDPRDGIFRPYLTPMKDTYNMAFFVSYPISTRDSHISPRAKGPRADMGRGLIWGMIRKMSYHNLFIIYFLLICSFSTFSILADIINSSFSTKELAAVAAIDIDQKPTRVIFHRITR